MKRPMLLLVALWLAAATPMLRAMPDPTQPPATFQARAAATAPAGAASATPGPATLRLQGLRDGHSALIDGRLRQVGERWQGHQLLRAEGRTAWLRDPEGRLLRLSLLPERQP